MRKMSLNVLVDKKHSINCDCFTVMQMLKFARVFWGYIFCDSVLFSYIYSGKTSRGHGEETRAA